MHELVASAPWRGAGVQGRAGTANQPALNANETTLAAMLFAGEPRACLSEEGAVRIVGIQRLDETAVLNVGLGDNWHMTWAADDRQFVGLCDGSGFKGIPGDPGEGINTRVYTIEGDAPEHRFGYLKNYPSTATIVSRFYGFGILALDGRVYQYLSTPRRRFGKDRRSQADLFTRQR